MYGLARRMYFCSSGINPSTSKDSLSVTMSCTTTGHGFVRVATCLV